MSRKARRGKRMRGGHGAGRARGYYNGDEVLACEGTGILPVIPKTQTSGNAKRAPLHRGGLYLRRRETIATPAPPEST